MNTCATCKWHGSKNFGGVNGMHVCVNPDLKAAASFPNHEQDWEPIVTSPEFGCNQWVEKPADA